MDHRARKSSQYERWSNQGECNWVFSHASIRMPMQSNLRMAGSTNSSIDTTSGGIVALASGSIDMEALSIRLPEIRKTLDENTLEDIYNMDETELFYRMQADNSLATRQLEGRKQNKERITIAICCNADGLDKMLLWVIGKSFNPRCFNNVNRENLGVSYHANHNVWMTPDVFKLWLKAFDMRMRGRKVVLLLDNCSAHITIEGLVEHNISLKNTTLLYLPPNTTSKIQPCDAGIIRDFKSYYHRRFNRMLLGRIDRIMEAPSKINVLDAIQLALASWGLDVKLDTIKNCFTHCKICLGHLVDGEDNDLDVDLPAEVIEELREQICSLRYNNPMDTNFMLNHPDEEHVAMSPLRKKSLNESPIECL